LESSQFPGKLKSLNNPFGNGPTPIGKIIKCPANPFEKKWKEMGKPWSHLGK